MSNIHSGVNLGGSSPPAGFRLGRYELVLRIGSGGVGQVYLARATGVGGFTRLFAIKMIHPHLSSSDAFSEALIREAQLASRIRHRNTVAVFDIGSHASFHFLVMEYIEGCSLAELCQANRTHRPPDRLGPIILDALYGLQAAHELQDDHGRQIRLIHRDFSPPNLLVGTDGTCRVTDFGIARTDNPSSVTNPGIIKGKPSYMAPEQVTGGAIDQRTDVFAAGVVLWNALTGKRLFDGPSEASTLYNVLRRKVPNPSEIGLKPDPAFDPILTKALQRDPSQRFQTAGEMAEALRAALLRTGMLGSSGEVSKWVTETFHKRLEARRRLICSLEPPREDEDFGRQQLPAVGYRAPEHSAKVVAPRVFIPSRPISKEASHPETSNSWQMQSHHPPASEPRYVSEISMVKRQPSPSMTNGFYAENSLGGERSQAQYLTSTSPWESILLVAGVAFVCSILVAGWWIYDREPSRFTVTRPALEFTHEATRPRPSVKPLVPPEKSVLGQP
ncbi:MAG: serine/threonine protein kinase [Myxococcales bacterium]|nr:serine/threonine protein kinase [Myxococcales bacterium]